MATTQQARGGRGGLLSRIPRPSADVWETVFGVVYVVMATNLLLALAGLPLVVLLMTTDPRASWPALAIAAVAAFPGLGAAAAVFSGYTVRRSTDVVRTFLTSWVRHLRRMLVLGLTCVGVTTLVALDVVWLLGGLDAAEGGAGVAGAGSAGQLGAVLVPFLGIIGALALSTTILAVVASVERPDARLRDVLKASLYLGLRRWYLTVGSFVVLGMLAGLFTLHPALALGLAAAPLLYVVWSNARFSLRPVLPVGAEAAPE